MFAQNDHLLNVRNLLAQSVEKEEAAEKLLILLEDVNDSNPLFYGYRGVSTIMLSMHKTLPWTKWEYFKKGKRMLEEAIKNDPSNYELHFLRYSIQSALPDILGYNANLQQDKELLMEGFASLKDKDLKNRVSKVMYSDTSIDSVGKN